MHKLADDASSVQFDLDVAWDGECDIQMRSDYGLQFGVKSVKLSGRMMGKVKITAVRGRGFKIQKKAFQKDNVPEVYLKVQFGSGKNQQKWQTGTVKDSAMPEWNESIQFAVNDQEGILRIEAFDEDKGVGDSNDFLGSAEVTVTELLLVAKEVELPLTVTKLGKSQSTGVFHHDRL